MCTHATVGFRSGRRSWGTGVRASMRWCLPWYTACTAARHANPEATTKAAQNNATMRTLTGGAGSTSTLASLFPTDRSSASVPDVIVLGAAQRAAPRRQISGRRPARPRQRSGSKAPTRLRTPAAW
jgi:hypothetical protein